MTDLSALWLPILLSAVAVFFVSSAIHTVSPWHKSDYPRLPDEDAVIAALRPLAIPPGDYLVPRAKGRAEMMAPEFLEKMQKGPVMIVTVIPNGPWSMGRNLSMWFAYLLAAGILIAYVTGRELPAGTPFSRVLQIGSATAFLAHVVALWPMSIWYRRDWGLTVKATVDGLIYALITGAVFAWLWPQ